MDTTYKPAAHALEHLKQVDFVAVIGPTAAGKTTLIREAMLRDPGLHLVLNNTSRARRPDEQEGVDYRFESRAAMEARIGRGEYAQVAPTLFGDLYATLATDYSSEGVAIMPVLADAMPAFRALPFKSIRSLFVLPPDWDTWQHRVGLHNFAPDKLAKRLAEARHSLTFALADTDTVFVVSRDGQQAADDFIALAHGSTIAGSLLADQQAAPGIARGLLHRLDV